MPENGYAFDTEPLVAFLYEEPGHENVADRLDEVGSGAVSGSIAEVTAAEVFYLLSRIEGVDGKPTHESLRVADRDVRSFERRGVSPRRADWRLAGEIEADGRLSLADASCVALAFERGETFVVGADDDVDDLPVDVTIERVRGDRV